MAELEAMKTVAAIDCGTNSIRLLIVRGEQPLSPLHNGFNWEELAREMRIVRLGQDIDRTKRFAPEALERTYQACREYRELIEKHNVEAIRFIGTSASRDASNRDEYLAKVKEILHVDVEVIPGQLEAQLSFTGAVSALGTATAKPAAPSNEKILLLDIGGGSTEFVLGQGKEILQARSVDIGSVRLYERYLREPLLAHQGDGSLCPERAPFMQEALAGAQAYMRELITDLNREFDFAQVDRIVGVAGTVTTVTATALGLSSYQPEKIGGARLSHEETLAACQQLMRMSVAERNQLGFMPQGRADVIGAGAIIWQEIIQQVSSYPNPPLTSSITSENDILDGIALSMF